MLSCGCDVGLPINKKEKSTPESYWGLIHSCDVPIILLLPASLSLNLSYFSTVGALEKI
jgi:hypothetical protein